MLKALLEDCAARSGAIEKTAPSEFDWNALRRQLAPKAQHRRRQTPAERAAALQGYKRKARDRRRKNREQVNHSARIRYWKNHEDARAKNNAILKKWRADPKNKLLSSERVSRRRAKSAARLNHKKELAHLDRIYSASIEELEHPSYKIISPNGRATPELWPLHDYAAAFIHAAELRAKLTALIAETTALLAESARSLGVPHPATGVPKIPGHQPETVLEWPHVVPTANPATIKRSKSLLLIILLIRAII